MGYCVNCKQIVKPRRDMSGAKKAIAIVSVLICIFLGSAMMWAASYTGNYDEASGVGGLFYLIAIIIPVTMYILEHKVCPVCKDENWGNSPTS